MPLAHRTWGQSFEAPLKDKARETPLEHRAGTELEAPLEDKARETLLEHRAWGQS
jgi:hypothetical protein